MLIGIGRIMRLMNIDYSTAIKLTKKTDFPPQIVQSLTCRGWDEDAVQDYIVKRMQRRKKN